MLMNQLIENLCEQRSRTSCHGSNHVAVLLEPKRYCVLPKGQNYGENKFKGMGCSIHAEEDVIRKMEESIQIKQIKKTKKNLIC